MIKSAFLTALAIGMGFLLVTSTVKAQETEEASEKPSPKTIEINIVNNQNDMIGIARIREATNGVLINIDVSNLPPGKHGMHFHEIGDCSDHDHFKEAGGHIEHYRPHGFLHPEGPHAGNLPNLIVTENGTAKVELYSNLVTLEGETYPLLDENGSTLIIHVNEDDHFTQPIGGAGARIACGLITK